ncbi:MAG: lysophospholipid acyltransferase family protein [Pseudomonadota bacterium]
MLDSAIRRGWITAWLLAGKYHRYEVEGIEHLDEQPALICGYHGRSLAADMCILAATLESRLGYLPHCFVHRTLRAAPGLSQVIEALGFLTDDVDEIAEAVERREHIVVTPGGAVEGMRTHHDDYRVHWPSKGYARLAIKYGLPIVPVAAAGADESYVGLIDGEEMAHRLGLSSKWSWATWTGLGPLGLYPFSPPFPARFYQVVGEPIPTQACDPDRPDDVTRLHEAVTTAVQELLDYAQKKKQELYP